MKGSEIRYCGSRGDGDMKMCTIRMSMEEGIQGGPYGGSHTRQYGGGEVVSIWKI